MKNITFKASYAQALKEAKGILKVTHSVKRLNLLTVSNTSVTCGCGESGAVLVEAKIKGEWVSQKIGVCKSCVDPFWK
jgi:hypothetical protein